jgi:alpha-ketoglutarate-dependent taurine dioxygenase
MSSHSKATPSKAQPIEKAIEPIHGFDFSDDGRRFTRLELRKLRSAVNQRLRQPPYFALVKECPGIQNAKDFRRLSKRFGRFPIGFDLRRLLRGKFSSGAVTEVKVDPKVAAENRNATKYSRTSEAMEPHTDGSYRANPHDTVIFYCVSSDDEGGETILVSIDDIVAKLGVDHCQSLCAPVFPFNRQVVPIIEGYPGNNTIRYYQKQLAKSVQQTEADLSVASYCALKALDDTLKDQTIQFRLMLQPCDLLFLNNKKILHGRTILGENSNRLLLRCRMFS